MGMNNLGFQLDGHQRRWDATASGVERGELSGAASSYLVLLQNLRVELRDSRHQGTFIHQPERCVITLDMQVGKGCDAGCPPAWFSRRRPTHGGTSSTRDGQLG